MLIYLADAYEMLILASIVEKETAIKRNAVSCLRVCQSFKTKYAATTDPTVIYGMGENMMAISVKKIYETPTVYAHN